MNKEVKDDVNYVHTLHKYANDEPTNLSKITFITISLFISLVIAWTTVAEIDEITRGNGKVIPSDKIQRIQSLDGGILLEILIKEGQFVKQGDELLKIDTTRYGASLEENVQGYLRLVAIKTRLEIESNLPLDLENKLVEPVFPEKVLKDHSRYDTLELTVFHNRVNELKSSLSVLNNELNQKREEYNEIVNTITNLEQNLELITEQRATIKKLVKAKIKSKYALLDVEKEFNQTNGEIGTAKISKNRALLAIKGAKHKIQEKRNNFKSEASSELQKTETEINKIEAKLVSDKDRVARTTITSPVKGIVKNISINTLGGVVKPGIDLVEIVPDSNVLLVEAKIDPKDIAFINPAQKAIVKITAYDFSIYGGLEAKIVEISADSIVDEESKDGKSYYRVLIKTDKNFLERNGKKLPIIPGMIASVDIITGKKTIAGFILKPILKVKQNAFHER